MHEADLEGVLQQATLLLRGWTSHHPMDLVIKAAELVAEHTKRAAPASYSRKRFRYSDKCKWKCCSKSSKSAKL